MLRGLKNLLWPKEAGTKLFGKIINRNLCVVLIDMQDFFIRQLRDGDAERIIPQQKIILNWCADNDIPVVVLEFSDSGQTISELNDLVSKVPTHIHITKTQNSGFTYTILDSWLRSKKIKSLLLMGINACFCVKDTARDAIGLGYRICTSPDLIGGMKFHDEDNGVEWYSKNGTVFKLCQSD